jgi:hypothetical protein
MNPLLSTCDDGLIPATPPCRIASESLIEFEFQQTLQYSDRLDRPNVTLTDGHGRILGNWFHNSKNAKHKSSIKGKNIDHRISLAYKQRGWYLQPHHSFGSPEIYCCKGLLCGNIRAN